MTPYRIPHSFWSLPVVTVLLLAAACGSGGDDAASPTVAANASTTATKSGVPTEATLVATNTAVAPSVVATSTAAATSTSSAAGEPTATDAAATATRAEPTATEDDDVTPTAEEGEDQVDIGDYTTIDPELLPNFTLMFTFDVTGVPDQEDTHLDLEIQQSSVENYHLRLGAADTEIETWLVDGTSWVAEPGGGVTEIPGGEDSGLFSPAMFLQQVPTIDPAMQAELVDDDDEVSGRSTSHYRVSGMDMMTFTNYLQGAEADADVQGYADIWIDNELRIMIKQTSDITWTNADGSEGAFLYDFLIDEIGSTPPVTAPQ